MPLSGLKLVLCIEELSLFRYTILLVFLRHYPLSLCVCVCVCFKILSILKRKNNKLIPHHKMSELKRFKTCAVYLRVRHFWIYTTVNFFSS